VWFKHNRLGLGKISLLLIIVVVVGLTAFGCVRPGGEPKGWSGGVIADGNLFLGSMEGELVALDAASGARLWVASLEISKPAGGGFGCAAPSSIVAIYGTPAVDGDLVYIGSYVKEGTLSQGKIYAFRFGRDEPKWVYPREGYLSGPVVGGPVVSQGKVYISCSDGKVYALDAAEGYGGWEFQTGDKIWSTPAIDGETLYIGSFDKKLYALSTADGSKKWEFETEGAIVSTPLVYEDIIYFGSFDRHLYAVDADGSLKWKFLAESWFWAKPVAYNGVIYAGCLDGKVYALDAKTGDKVGEFDLDSPISSAPVLVNSSIIIASEEGRVYSLDTASNQMNELASLEEEKVYAPLSASEGTVFIHTEKDVLYALDSETAAIREFHIK